MFLFSFIPLVVPPPPDTSCEKALSETSLVRIIEHQAGGWMGSITLFFMQSNDRGQTWRKMDSRIFDAEEVYTSLTPNCDKIGWLDDRFFWVWFGGEAKIFRDGKLWHNIGPCALNDCRPHGLYGIVDMQFQDGQSGYISIADWGQAATSRYATDDGGLTWRLAEQ